MTWCMVVWCTQNALGWQQFHVAPAITVLWVHHFGEYLTVHYKKLFTLVESHASILTLLESGEWRYIKVINNNILQEVKCANIYQMHFCPPCLKSGHIFSKFQTLCQCQVLLALLVTCYLMTCWLSASLKCSVTKERYASGKVTKDWCVSRAWP